MLSERSDLTSTWLDVLSRRCRVRFRRRNLRVRSSGRVHETGWDEGIGGYDYPHPGCNVGVSGWDLEAFHPTDAPVNCERCLHNMKTRAAPNDPVVPVGQLAFSLDV